MQHRNVVGDRSLRRGDAVEVDRAVGGQNAVRIQGGPVLADHLARSEANAEGIVVVLGVPVALGENEFADEVPGGDGAFGDAGVGGV